MFRAIRRPPRELLAGCLRVLALLLSTFRPHALPSDLSESVMRLLDAQWNTAATITMQDVKSAVDHLHRRLGGEFHFFLVLSHPRTGTTMLAELLNSHPNVTMYGEFFNEDPQHGPRVNRFALDSKNPTLTDAWNYLKRDLPHCSTYFCAGGSKRKTHTTHIGFQLMEHQIQYVKGPTELPNGTIILNLRRNTLRTVISQSINLDKGGRHARTNKEAASMRQEGKIKLDAKRVVHDIEHILHTDTDMLSRLTGDPQAMQSFDRRCISHYENWVNPLVRSAQLAVTLNCLGLSHARLHTDLVPVHQANPVLESVANAQEIAAVLRASPFEYMLEENKSSVEVFRSLLKSDDFTHTRHLAEISQRAR